MDLFVINRYRDSDEDVDLTTQENKHLQKLKQKIEERKKAINNSKKHISEISIKPQVHKEVLLQPTERNISEVADKTIIGRKGNEDLLLNEKTVDDNYMKEFKVLGVNDFETKEKVKRVLPYWLSHPNLISTNLHDLSCTIESVKWLDNTLKTALVGNGVTHLFPVQQEVVPFILQEHKNSHPLWPRDVCVSAPTGSGKTLSFVLPIIQVLMSEIGCYVRALIVLPVQELATQVSNVFKKYSGRTGLKVALLSGSVPLRQEQLQIVKYTEAAGWISEVDIIVCTAGRLVEHIQNTEGFSLEKLKFLVIDEADRIMDHIQNDWLYHLDRHIKLKNELMTGKNNNLNWKSLTELRSPPQKLLFSATLSQDPEKLEQWGLFQPMLFSSAKMEDLEDEIDIRKYTTPDELKEEFVTCTSEEKPLVLFHFLVEQNWDKVLCFTNSAQSAHRLTILLNTWARGKPIVAELSAALDRSNRDTVLKKFTHSQINVLIGTDALARGIDVPNCDYVISYDPPKNIKTYIHRVGRTGRAGRVGHAVTILLPNQTNLFKDLLKLGSKNELSQIYINPDIFKRLSNNYQEALNEMKGKVNAETQSKVQKSIELKRGIKGKATKRKLNDIRK